MTTKEANREFRDILLIKLSQFFQQAKGRKYRGALYKIIRGHTKSMSHANIVWGLRQTSCTKYFFEKTGKICLHI